MASAGRELAPAADARRRCQGVRHRDPRARCPSQRRRSAAGQSCAVLRRRRLLSFMSCVCAGARDHARAGMRARRDRATAAARPPYVDWAIAAGIRRLHALVRLQATARRINRTAHGGGSRTGGSGRGCAGGGGRLAAEGVREEEVAAEGATGATALPTKSTNDTLIASLRIHLVRRCDHVHRLAMDCRHCLHLHLARRRLQMMGVWSCRPHSSQAAVGESTVVASVQLSRAHVDGGRARHPAHIWSGVAASDMTSVFLPPPLLPMPAARRHVCCRDAHAEVALTISTCAAGLRVTPKISPGSC